MGVGEVFEVLYSPIKAFKKIVEKPDFEGVILILILFMSLTVVEQYVIASKLLLLDQTPDNDDWTESIAFWASNGLLSIDDANYKVGNYSVKAFVSNGANIWMNITNIGPLDCSEDTGYKELFFWINWIHSNGTFPSSNATLRLFSVNESYFERSLTNFISNSSAKWSNATLKIGSENQDWVVINSPDWKNITGLEIRLAWLTSANLTLKIDDLHFRKHSSLLDMGVFSGSLISILMSVAIEFLMNWVLWAGVLLLVAKVFREGGEGKWTTFFIIIGHVFIITVIYTIASAALISTLSPLNLPTKTWPPTTEEEATAVNALFKEEWNPNLAYRLYLMLHFISFSGITIYFPFLREVWTLVLCLIAIRQLRGITWGKATNISTVAFIIRSILRFFLGV